MSIFGICFLTGLGILLFNLIFGSISDFFSMDLDWSFHDVQGDLAHGFLGFVSPSTLSGFLIAFGGMGYFFEKLHFNPFLIWLIAIVSGVIAGWALFQLVRFLRHHENGAAPEMDDIVGLPATVVGAIQKDGFGSIRYVYNGSSFSSPAVSYDGVYIPQGEQVAIVAIKDHVFYVSELNLEE